MLKTDLDRVVDDYIAEQLVAVTFPFKCRVGPSRVRSFVRDISKRRYRSKSRRTSWCRSITVRVAAILIATRILSDRSIDARGIDANELVAKTMATMKKKVLLIEIRLAAKGRKAAYSSPGVTRIGQADDGSSLASQSRSDELGRTFRSRVRVSPSCVDYVPRTRCQRARVPHGREYFYAPWRTSPICTRFCPTLSSIRPTCGGSSVRSLPRQLRLPLLRDAQGGRPYATRAVITAEAPAVRQCAIVRISDDVCSGAPTNTF
jgi:hypothetical protein